MAPTISISTDDSLLNGTDTAHLTFATSETTTTFTAGDVAVLGGTLTGFGFILTRGFNLPAQVLSAATLAILLAGTFAGQITWLGRATAYVETISLSTSYLLLMVFTTTETLTRLPRRQVVGDPDRGVTGVGDDDGVRIQNPIDIEHQPLGADRASPLISEPLQGVAPPNETFRDDGRGVLRGRFAPAEVSAL